MKKFLKPSTGIVFIITILIAAGCGPANENEDKSSVKEVIIFVSSYEINGEIHLKMFDSNGNWAIDSLYTDVMPGNRVIWKLDTLCGISKINYIKGTTGNIIKKDPKSLEELLGKQLELDLPDDIEGEEKYEIKFKMEDGTDHIIDPFLRVRPDPTP